jgi:hypothetical protein
MIPVILPADVWAGIGRARQNNPTTSRKSVTRDFLLINPPDELSAGELCQMDRDGERDKPA